MTSIANGFYNAFGVIGVFPNGNQLIACRQSTSHFATNQYGKAVTYKSTDGGTSFPQAATIVVDESAGLISIGDIAGGVTPSGRFVLNYDRVNPAGGAGGPGYYLGSKSIYTDDQGASWSAAVAIAPATTYTGGVQSPTIAIGATKLLQGYYQWNAVTGPFELWVTFSSNDGAAWGGDVKVATSPTVQLSEATFLYLGSSQILCLCRADNGTSYTQFVSTDNGATWTNQGVTSFDTWATPNPCALLLQGSTVVCLYVNRNNGHLCWTSASAASLVATGPSVWAAPTIIAEGFTISDSGYTAAARTAAGAATFWAYNTPSANVANIDIFTCPPF